MAWGWFSPAWLEYSYYWGLACSIGLVYHGLNYSSSSINKPATKKRKANGYWRGRLPPIPKPSRPAAALSVGLHGDANTAKPLTPMTFESTSLGFPSWFMFACFLPQSDTSISSFHGGISRVFRKQYRQRSSQFRTGHKKKRVKPARCSWGHLLPPPH